MTTEQRRRDLETALHERRDFLEIRSDSALCRQFINGELPASDLEHVVDVVDEMHFFYNLTSYASIIRGMRTQRREWDRFVENRAYCKRQYRNDNPFHDEEDLTSESDYEEAEEDERRKIAKRKALAKWISGNPDCLQHLPRTLAPKYSK
jgi:hypothetical protein